MSLDLPKTCPRPLVVMLGVPEAELKISTKELIEEGFDVESIGDNFALIEKISNTRCFAVIVGESTNSDPLKLLQSSRALGQAQWILLSQSSEKTTYRAHAFSLGAAAVQNFPPPRGSLLSELRRLFVEEQNAYLRRVAPDQRRGIDEKFRRLDSFQPNNNFRSRREWPQLSDPAEMRAIGHTSVGQIRGFDSLLERLERDSEEIDVRFRLVSFGVQSALIPDVPDEFVVLSSNHSVFPTQLLTPVRLYPEVQAALLKKEPIYVTDLNSEEVFSGFLTKFDPVLVKEVAAVPLLKDGRVFAMFLLSFSMKPNDGRYEFLEDFAAYATEITPFVQNLDFFARIYRENPKILSMHRTTGLPVADSENSL